jgi:ATP-binding protein involved in chromosome partitioning
MRLVGAVENMSYLVGSGDELFGSGGGEALARQIGKPLLAQIPLDPALREAADRGEPLVWESPDAQSSIAIVQLAEAIAETRREAGIGIGKSLPLAGTRS